MSKIKTLIFLLIIFFAACNNKLEQRCFPPSLIIQERADTLKVGERYYAQIYISDTSFYRFHVHENENLRIIPVMKFNDKPVKVVKDTGWVEFEINIDSSSINEKNKNGFIEQEWTGTLMFPNPNGGDVILSKFVRYYIDVR